MQNVIVPQPPSFTRQSASGHLIQGETLLYVVIVIKQGSPGTFCLHKATWAPSACTFAWQGPPFRTTVLMRTIVSCKSSML